MCKCCAHLEVYLLPIVEPLDGGRGDANGWTLQCERPTYHHLGAQLQPRLIYRRWDWKCGELTLIMLAFLENAKIADIQYLCDGDAYCYLCRSITATFRKYIIFWSHDQI